MSPNLLNDILVKMSGIAQKAASQIIGMLQTTIGHQGHLGSLGKLSLIRLQLEMLMLDPAVMDSGSFMGDVLLENNDIGVGYLLCLCR